MTRSTQSATASAELAGSGRLAVKRVRRVLPVDAVAGSSRLEEPWEGLRDRPIDQLVREDVPMSSAPITAETLSGLGFDVHLVTERELGLAPDRLLLVAGNPRAYKGTLATPRLDGSRRAPDDDRLAHGATSHATSCRAPARAVDDARARQDRASGSEDQRPLLEREVPEGSREARTSSTYSPWRPTRTRRISRSRAWTSRSCRSDTIPPSGRPSTASATSTCSSSATSVSGGAGGS